MSGPDSDPPDAVPVTRLLRRWSAGDRSCEAELFDAVYAELSEIGERHMRMERAGHTLEPAALVHEAYLRLREADQNLTDRVHFFAIASRVMRRLLIDHARARQADKRSGGARLVTLRTDLDAPESPPVDASRLEEALARLERLDPQKAELVAMRHLAGLTNEEIADQKGISERSVRRGLAFARAFVRRELAR